MHFYLFSEEQEQDEKPPGSQEKTNGPDDKVMTWNILLYVEYCLYVISWHVLIKFWWIFYLNVLTNIILQVNIADKIRAKMENVKENVSAIIIFWIISI